MVAEYAAPPLWSPVRVRRPGARVQIPLALPGEQEEKAEEDGDRREEPDRTPALHGAGEGLLEGRGARHGQHSIGRADGAVKRLPSLALQTTETEIGVHVTW